MQKEKLKVPLIQQDLSHEETVLQIAFALDSLEAAVNSVFTSVEDRLKIERTRLQDIHRRCENCKEKVQKLKGITKSITAYSSAKYPVPSQNLFFEDLKFTACVKRPEIIIKHTPLSVNKLSLKEKMKFYHVKDSTQLLRKNEEVTPFEGLGSMPDNLKSVCSLLLFNTTENLYDNYKILDPLAVPKQPSFTAVEKTKPELEPAPASLISNEPLGFKYISSYFYNPMSQDVPEIHVPMDLPRLSGIAGDLRYVEDVAIVKDVCDNEPTSSRLEITEDKVTLVQELPKVEESVPSERLVPPPPPPPPPPPVIEPDPPPAIGPESPPVQVLVDHGVAPQLKSVPKSEAVNSSRLPQPPPVDDMRANLMEAIRQAGGKNKLKPISSSQEKKVSSASSNPMSFHDDLRDKLLMRRKGILGKSEGGDGNLLETIATMIPPPPPKQHESDEEDEDDQEWED